MKTKGVYKATMDIGSEHFLYHDITGPERDGQRKLDHLPFVIRILLEDLLRHHDGERVTDAHVQALANWNGTGGPIFPYLPSRVLLQDFTGVPAVVDLAAMRTSLEEAGGDPDKVNPVIPVDLIIDHSVTVDCHGTADALACNVRHEFDRNEERYRFLRWAQEAFDRFRVFPPSVGICHQVNLEYLATVVTEKETEAGTLLHPDSLVGTDSHTPMVNGIGVLGWGVGGIEAEACMLGLPLDMPLPDVVGVELTCRLSGQATATDLALTVTNLLRNAGVVGCFVEYFGEGLNGITVEDRATVANMAPEYGATTGFFPVDDATLAYLRATGRPERHVALVEAYTKAQHLFRTAHAPTPLYTRTIPLDLSTVVPAMAGPYRPQDLVPLEDLPYALAQAVQEATPDLAVIYADGTTETLRTGAIVLAAITSCTNTSNPHALLLAGLVAKKAAEVGLTLPRYVKASLAPALVVAAALAGTVDLDMTRNPLGTTADGTSIFLSDLWPEPEEVAKTAHAFLSADTFRTAYRNILSANVIWNALPQPTATRYAWEDASTYIRRPPFLDNVPTVSCDDIRGHAQKESEKVNVADTPCRILALLGDSVTTDHISPAGSIPVDTPAGRYLLAHGVAPEAFNSYGSRRGNHEVMMRGTFANIRIRNRLVPEKEGGWTQHWPDGDILPIFTACERYEKEGVSLMVIAGTEYGTGSSRDWAAKGTVLLGVKAVLAGSYERIHRSNLVGMGVLPLQFPEGESAESWGLTGREIIRLPGIPTDTDPGAMIRLVLQEASGKQREQNVLLRLDSPAEVRIWQSGGILRQVLRNLVEDHAWNKRRRNPSSTMNGN